MPRQAWIWLEQLLATHCPHDTPAGTQKPPLHWLLQHCAPLVHICPRGLQPTHALLAHAPEQQLASLAQSPPWGVHIEAPHLPAEQAPVQHSFACTQEIPSGVHAMGPQKAPLHWPVQHSFALAHICPSGLHAGGPQRPFEHWPVQHSFALAHICPSGLHAGGPQRPFEHWLEQHSAGTPQASPFGLHGGVNWQIPPMQILLQHSPLLTHPCPVAVQAGQGIPQIEVTSFRQISSQLWSQQKGSAEQIRDTHESQSASSGPPSVQALWAQGVAALQKPFVHTPLQQLSSTLHGVPVELHPSAQIPAVQSRLQHSMLRLHGAPAGVHWLLQIPPAQTPLQHSVGPMQGAPRGAHPPPQTPAQVLEQHSAAVLHGTPSGLHWSWQKPPLHEPLQHSAFVVQPAPWGVQPPQMPFVQRPLQHGADVEHPSPSGKQLCVHTPVGPQPPEQHSASSAQAPPRGLHIGTEQAPPSHVLPAQHSAASSHGPPTGTQAGASGPASTAPPPTAPPSGAGSASNGSDTRAPHPARPPSRERSERSAIRTTKRALRSIGRAYPRSRPRGGSLSRASSARPRGMASRRSGASPSAERDVASNGTGRALQREV